MTFMKKLEETANDLYNVSITENGAVGRATTGKKILDMNFKLSSYRNLKENDILSDFRDAFKEDPVTAVKWLFYVRDAREGQGERRFFRYVITDLCRNGFNEYSMINLIRLIPEYGRFDDLLCLLDTKYRKVVCNFFRTTLYDDVRNMKGYKPISLLAKWMPSENASSAETKRYANIIMKELNMSPSKYRKMLSTLRSYIDVIEIKMSSNNWNEIDYEKVPSRANLIYKDAFMKHDRDRRIEYLEALKRGDAKINASVLYPHDIVSKYGISDGWSYRLNPEVDDALEEMWKNLPNLVDGNDSTIVVADGSGSMMSVIGKTSVSALSVANAIAIYFAERCNGQFKNKYITFSNRPQIVNLGDGNLKSKIQIALRHNECENTNVEAVFDLILDTAVRNHMTQDEIPHNILIVSDMEFDACAECNSKRTGYWGRVKFQSTLFDAIKRKYESYGYKLPKLIFWNVMSRTNTIPITENDMGVILVSGFSVNTMKMVMSNKTDPYEALLETINSKRYAPVEDAIVKI